MIQALLPVSVKSLGSKQALCWIREQSVHSMSKRLRGTAFTEGSDRIFNLRTDVVIINRRRYAVNRGDQVCKIIGNCV